MFLRTKDSKGYVNMSYTVLLDFLKQNANKAGKIQDTIELRCFVPFVKAEIDDDLFHWVFSSFDIDRSLERIDPCGWELEHYKSNPVILWAHNSAIPAIGYAKNVTCDTELKGDVVFNDKSFDQFGWSIGQRVKYGSIRSGSVGLLLKEVEFVDKKKTPDEKAEVIFRQQELLEFSICNVPQNPFATVENTFGKNTVEDVEKSYDFFSLITGGIHSGESADNCA